MVPILFLGACNQYLQFGVRLLATDEGISVPDFAGRLVSLVKALFLDIELTLDAYFTESTQQLRQALEMVFRANAELRQFAQLTGHDLKTPLATVANLCDEALDEFADDMPAEAAQLIAAARERAYRMSRMIDELLRLSAAGDDSAANVKTDSRQILNEVYARFADRLAAAQIDLTVGADLPLVRANPAGLREAFSNLLSNAVRFIDKKPGWIQITTTLADDECIFHFADNGPGIPPQNLQQIFSPFRRLPAHQHLPGSGLGLYFTKNLVERQGGRVWAESEPGKGSVFHVQLKRC